MKHLKTANNLLTNNRSFDGDDHSALQTHYNSSSTSLNNVTTTNYHDFELRKRDTITGECIFRKIIGNSKFFRFR
jgi:hypothetical protein